MRQYRKKEILETADLLIEGNNYITNSYRTGNKEHIMEILSQSQEMAIILGNCLETFEEAGKVLVPILEDYCEKIYQFSQNLSDEFICRKIAKQTTRQLAGLKVNIIEQIPEDKIEIVFFPYKASMWDSLESVWRAAAEDPECDAYVVPIPYFERNQQGELAVMHYEGDQFPKEVPVVHYMDYNLAEKRPDVAFIHNPYDQYNHVTSIHPAYYVPELKKYVQKVAYIPYFISPEPNPDSLEAQAQKKGFVLQPGVTDTDLVFVQSEDMKRLYVNILEKEIPNVNRKLWEDKIFGLGSPKLDRVHSTKRNDDLLSATWHSLIYDNAGNRKKVIFYNTSLHDLLNQENMMEKIADTLAFFKEREDYVLWWRPHPLYESTLASMKPELLSIYKKMVEKYKTEGWGILDVGEDLDWAIAETDAYYGDGSSVVQLYKEVGKPVLYQDTRVKNSVEEEVEIPVWPCAFCVDGDDIWFVHGMINVLMKYNMSKDYTYVIGRIPNEEIFQERSYMGMYKWKNTIYLIPSHAREIAIYNVDTGKFKKITIDGIDDFKGKVLFGKVYARGKELYCIPCYYNAILKVEMESQETKYIKIKGGNKRGISDSVRVHDKIIAVHECSNQVLLLDMKNDSIFLKQLGDIDRKFTSITSIQEKLYIYDRKLSAVFRIEGKNYEIETKFCEIEGNGIGMSGILPDKIILDPADRVGLQIMNTKKEIVFREEWKNIIRNSMCSVYFNGINSCGNINNQKFYYFSRTAYLMYQFDGEGLERTFKIRLNKNELAKLAKIALEVQQQNGKENDIFKLIIWIENLLEQEDRNLRKDCGTQILQVTKEF